MFTTLKKNILRITQILIALLAGFWIIAGVYAIATSANHVNTPVWIFLSMGVLMLLDAGMLLFFARGLENHSIRYYRLSMLLLAVNAALIFTDQVGFSDMLVFFATLAPLLILLIRRSAFIKPGVPA